MTIPTIYCFLHSRMISFLVIQPFILARTLFKCIQGEVEQISLMKPRAQGPHDEGFLEYLEDIIGTDKYVEKIEESYKQ